MSDPAMRRVLLTSGDITTYTCNHEAMTSDDHAASIKSLDLPAKVRLLTGASAFTLAPDASIGLGEMRFSDGPTGVRGLKFSGGRVVALFPNATLLSSFWDEAAAYEMGK